MHYQVREADEVFSDSVDALMFELRHMVGRTKIGGGLGLELCGALAQRGAAVEECLARIDKMEGEVKGIFDYLAGAKRGNICPKVKLSPKSTIKSNVNIRTGTKVRTSQTQHGSISPSFRDGAGNFDWISSGERYYPRK